MASSVFLNLSKSVKKLQLEFDKLRSVDDVDEKILKIETAIDSVVSRIKNLEGENKMVDIEAVIKRLEIKEEQASRPPATPVQLQIQSGTEQSTKELSPRIKAKLVNLDFEAIGGQVVRCINCGKEQAYHSKRIASHVCRD